MSLMAWVGRRLRLSSDARRVRAERLTYLDEVKVSRLERHARAVLKTGVPGDVLEFGVALGGSAIVLAKLATRHRRRFAGFDVFGRIPPPTSEMDDDKSRDRYAVISSGQSKGIGGDGYYGYRSDLYDAVVHAFGRYDLTVDGEAVALHKGLFEETWPVHVTPSVAFAHIDCDWYEPVKYCLEALEKPLSRGGEIILDDYHDYGGCLAAADEFLAAHPNFEMHDGRNVVLRKN